MSASNEKSNGMADDDSTSDNEAVERGRSEAFMEESCIQEERNDESEGDTFTVVINLPSGQESRINVNPNLGVENLKALLVERLPELNDWSPKHIRLVKAGRVLADGRRLHYYSLSPNDRLFLLDNRPRQPSSGSAASPAGSSAQSYHDFMAQMLNSPLASSLLDDPEIIRSMLDSSAQMRELRERHPELSQILNDPQLLRQTMEVVRNPTLMREMIRSTDRALSNIEAVPGGFNALRRMYHSVEEPMWQATVDAAFGSGQNPGNRDNADQYDLQTDDAPNTDPLPNPWEKSTPPPVGAPPQPQSRRPIAAVPPQLVSPHTQSANPVPLQTPSVIQQAMQRLSLNVAPQVQPTEVVETGASFAHQLIQLQSMGFNDTEACLHALRASNGNINRAIDYLLNYVPRGRP